LIVDGSGPAEGTKSCSLFLDEVPGNRYSGVVIEEGSGTAKGTTPSSSGVDVPGNLYSGTVTDDGSGTAEGTASGEVVGNI